MKIGISSACVYPLETEKALYELAVRGIDRVELFINSVDELEGDILREIKNVISSYNISVSSVHPFSSPMESVFLFGNYERRVRYLADIYERYFEVMAQLSAEIFVLHGAISSSHVPDDRYIERYAMLYEKAKKYGVTVAQENICYCKSRDVGFLKKISDTLGENCAFVLDLKQARRSGTDPFEIISALGRKIVHYHVSDGNEQGDCLPVGEGAFDFERLFKTADELNYDGSFIVELYRENYSSYDDLAAYVDSLKKKYDEYKSLKNT